MRLVLASASPARLRLLRAAGLNPEVVVSSVDEDPVQAPTVAELVQTLAAMKADDVAARIAAEPSGRDPSLNGTVVIGCDSLLELDGVGLGKPGSVAVARERWQKQAGRTAFLQTGHSLRVVTDGAVSSRSDGTDSTAVHFGTPTEAELEWYLASGEPLGVAGAFTIDGLGGWLVDSIGGDHHNVIGLSLRTFKSLLTDVGLTLGHLINTQ